MVSMLVIKILNMRTDLLSIGVKTLWMDPTHIIHCSHSGVEVRGSFKTRESQFKSCLACQYDFGSVAASPIGLAG